MGIAFFDVILTLGFLAIAWLVLIGLAIFFGHEVGRGGSKKMPIVLSVLSLPAFLVAHQLYEKLYFKYIDLRNDNITIESVTVFRRLCGQKNATQINKVVNQAMPVNIQIRQPSGRRYIFLELNASAKVVCWTQAGSPNCARPNLGKYQWEEEFGLAPCAKGRTAKECGYKKEYDIATNTSSEIPQLSAPYILRVSKPEIVDPLIDRTRVAVIDAKTAETLGTTEFYTMEWFNGPRLSADGKPIPRYCPDRDPLVAELLARVFPMPGATD
jgi:hypothetical protein